MMKKISRAITFIFILIFFLSEKSEAQQQGQYSQYMLNYFLINPAVGGTEDYADLRGGYRQQWTGMTGAPQNYYLTGHTPLNKIHGRHDKKFSNKIARPHHFAGAMLNGQRLGAFSQTSIYGTYGYYLPLNKQWNLSMAVSLGMLQYTLNQSKLDFGDDVADPAVNYAKGFKPDMGLGIWLSSKKFFAGISTMQLFENKLGETGALSHHFYITSGYSIDLNRDWNFVPSLLVKAVPFSAYQLDVNAKIKFRKLLWTGVSYRKADAFIFMAGVCIQKHIEIGYSYDLTTSRLSASSKGSHEIMLALKLANKARVISPSDFW